ncbi:hypothetical protein [Nitrosomonas sp. HPC101]|uniref:hypothetical protein n=1 Tax=Nitrosomonas sp. HPC101 TaxID=1658667 RepID=UPI00136C0501|nr:hypothetical protein [Nitrosomonas sp. HPC101]
MKFSGVMGNGNRHSNPATVTKIWPARSFRAESDLFEYVLFFVTNNSILTKYCSNTVRNGHLKKASA